MSVLQQPVLPLDQDRPVLPQFVLLPFDMSVPQQPKLPIDMSVYSRMCCPGYACSTSAFAAPGLVVPWQAVCAGPRHVWPTAAYSLSLNMYGPQQPLLSLEVSRLQKLVLHLNVSVWGCGVAMWLARRAAVRQSRVRIPPGTPPLVQPRKIQEQKSIGADFSQRSSRRFQRSSRRISPCITKDEYCINTVDRTLEKKEKKNVSVYKSFYAASGCVCLQVLCCT